ncbi:MAG TPA: FAD-binding oxidoreductase, partial [Candidatus Hodarchaeales archaeon]|nr:FAD-binding oxidoreductase [Candidatus Hodarchaeales archaeon]
MYPDVSSRLAGEELGTKTQYLSDEAGIVKGNAERIFFPETEEDIIELTKLATKARIPITISGGGTGISGGRVPLGGWIVATDKMRKLPSNDRSQEFPKEIWNDPETGIGYEIRLETLDEDDALITVPVSMPLKALQAWSSRHGWFYPPDPTERSAFLGGNVACNASGARSFKFGATRTWIEALRVVLPNGDLIILRREMKERLGDKKNIILRSKNRTYSVPRPTYKNPELRKNVAGPVLENQSDPSDLFIGTDGIFGIITEVTARLIRPPKTIVSIIAFCSTREQAMSLIQTCQEKREAKLHPIPMSVEYADAAALTIVRSNYPQIPKNVACIVYLEQDVDREAEIEEILNYWDNLLNDQSIKDTWVEYSPIGIETHKQFRHSMPEAVNRLVRRNGQAKLGTDYSVPRENFKEFLDYVYLCGDRFEKFQLDQGTKGGVPSYVVWAHAGDSHVHLNFLPKSDSESLYAKGLLIEMMKTVVSSGGSIAAEHGLGKKAFNGRP